jgi:hypothetical protein
MPLMLFPAGRVGSLFSTYQYELCKNTIKYDRDLGRGQHRYPSSEELPV